MAGSCCPAPPCNQIGTSRIHQIQPLHLLMQGVFFVSLVSLLSPAPLTPSISLSLTLSLSLSHPRTHTQAHTRTTLPAWSIGTTQHCERHNHSNAFLQTFQVISIKSLMCCSGQVKVWDRSTQEGGVKEMLALVCILTAERRVRDRTLTFGPPQAT